MKIKQHLFLNMLFVCIAMLSISSNVAAATDAGNGFKNPGTHDAKAAFVNTPEVDGACIPTLNNACVLYFTNITIGSINNNTGCDGGYNDYTGLSTEMTIGVPESISISVANYGHYVSVFIDLNDNGNLNDPGEQVLSNLHIPAWNTGTATITIPESAAPGNHLMRVIGEFEGSGYANNPCFHEHGEAEDYTVNIPCGATPMVFYADTDGDGYGDPAVSETVLCPSAGYVQDNTDCNDSDANYHINQNWYYDGDGDGYYGQVQSSCNPPAPSGWSLTTAGPDCNDTDANIHPQATDTPGNSVDENCNGIINEACAPVIYNPCFMYLYNVTIGSINNNSSCNGTYSNFTSLSTEMEMESTQTISFSAANHDQYVSVYIDFDQDGILTDAGERVVNNLLIPLWSTGSTTFTLPANITPGTYLMRVISTFYNDGPSNNPCGETYFGEAEDYVAIISCAATPISYYADADGDRYGDPAVSETALCPSPGYIVDNTDCNDSDANYHINQDWYYDGDGDGYHGTVQNTCTPPAPNGWSLTTTGPDCNDADAAINPVAAEIAGNDIDDNCNGGVDDCTPVFGNNCLVAFSNVSIGSINNTTGCSGSYSNYTAMSTSALAGSEVPVSFSATNDVYISVYIDFNKNGILNDPGEQVLNNLFVHYVGSGSFNLPGVITPGNYQMRAICVLANGLSYNSCGGTEYGDAEDYTMTIACPLDPATYYADVDGDLYGDPAVSETALCPSPGYILDNTDCYDGDANYHINQNWYYDGDGDGYHGQVQNSCTPPAPSGWSLTTPGPDCNDTDAAINPVAAEIAGNDIDDNCNGGVDDCTPVFVNNCIVFFTNVSIGSINNTTSCSGAYQNYTAMSTSALAGSTVPVSFSLTHDVYVSIYIDFNKNGILNDPGEQVLNNQYVPFAGSGSINLPAILTPGNYQMRVVCTYAGSGPSSNPCGGTEYGEAEDYTMTITCPVEPVTYYADADGDGYGDPAVSETALCPSPGYLLDNTDCNDSDANYHINQDWYYDGDGDGYHGTVQSACTPPAPNGWSLTTPGPDCNDTDAAINPVAAEIADNDIDDNCNGGVDDCTPVFWNNCIVAFSNVSIGSINNTTGCSGSYSNYTAMSTSALAGSEVPVSFSATNDVYISVYIDFNKNGILNDPGEQVLNNLFVHYVGGGSFNLPGVITPGNYQMRAICVLANGLSYNSCGGTEYGDAEDYTMTIACPVEPVTYYADADGDGYGDPATTETALCPSPGYIADNTDCNDTDALLHALQNWYYDGDGDGYYGSVQSSCGAPDITGWSLSTSGVDCNDNDFNINVNAPEIPGNSVDDNCNGAIDDCTPVLYNPCVLYMTNVTIGSINNNSDCQGGYSNFTSQSTELLMGIPQAIAISAAHYGQYVSVFIDFNDNGVLNDAGEQVLHNLHVPAWNTSNGYLIIPGTATQGSHLMRVFSEYEGSGLANDPCFHHHGEAEDYTAIISCPSTPVAYYADADGDGYGDPGTSESALCPSPGYVYDNTDCNDADPAHHVLANWYHDVDGDGYNVGTVSSCGPPEPSGWTVYTSGTDCDDNNYYVNPSITEIQGNSVDDNCNGIVDEACIPYGGNCVLYISQVTIGSIDNASSCSSGYENYEGLSTDMALGSTQSISVTGVNYPQYISVFIDFNNNHILSDAGEQVVSNIWVDPFTTSTTTFTVPTSALVGNHLMRVMGEYVGNGLADNPCYHAQSEVEDYTVNITCSDTPLDWFADSDGDSYGNPAISSSDVCPPVGYVNNDDDCDDSNAAAHPGAQDIVDSGVDENCNGITDDPCVPVIYYPCIMYINNVTIGAINNSSSCSNYTDYTSLSTEMEMGGTQSVSISGSTYNQFVSVYIDFNENGIMNEAGERVVNNLFVPAESTGNTTFTLPLNAIPGSYRMRVISNFENEGGANNPCGQTNYGEAEDYTLIINCPSTPSTYYADSDGDGYGDPNNFETVLCPSSGYILDNTDCNDSNANIHLGATEVVGNGIDDNCNGYIDECTPTFQNPCTVFFSNVTIGSINNTTTCIGAYADYTNLSTEVIPGSTQTISITNQSYDQLISVYLDINDNGNMQESGEMVVDNLMVLNGQTVSATFTIPATILPGNYRLRVISNFFGHEANYDPCGNTIFGEAEDYTLTVVCPDLSTTYYADTDGDGYGDPNSTTAVADCAPEGYVLNNDDCDDTDAAVNPGATEILANMIDDDCDNEIDELPYCVPNIIEPCSYLSISINHVTMGAIDNASTCNSTGYENFRSQSTSIPAGQNQEYSVTMDIQAYPYGYLAIFVDFNRDGYFNGDQELVIGAFVEDVNNTLSGSFPIPLWVTPGNYIVRVMTDHNGYNDPCLSIFGEAEDYTLTVTCPTTSVTYYADADGDGYGDPTVTTSEAGCAPSGFVADNTDCDDTNAAYHENIYWFLDADGDGYYGEYAYGCAPPEGEGWSNESGSPDCDDNNPLYHANTWWYYDGDGDGYFGNEVYTCIPPEGEGWSLDYYDSDCDDTNASYFYYTSWYYDEDGDGFYSEYTYSCIPPEGEGWTLYSYDLDCDDTNPSYTYGSYWYYDADGDGYFASYVYACVVPEGEGWSPYGYGLDCDDTNAAFTYEQSWYYDGDGDGAYGENIYSCTHPDEEGWSDQGNYEDCDDNDPLYQTTYFYYLDADADGYHADFIVGCVLPEGGGWSENYGSGGNDCDDSNADIHPGSEYLGNGIDDNCDGLIDVLVYCTPDGYTECYYNNYINNVELGTMSNASGCSSGYADYSQLVVSADAGDEITYSVSTADYSILNIFIDYNQDGELNDDGEMVVNDYNFQYGVPYTGTITLPSGLADGSYRVRIKADYGYYDNEPCYYYYGEVEDYTIIIGDVCADIDLDGYTDQACGGNDCDDNNSAINPGATEICNGDIDDNCNGTADDADNTVTGQGTYYADGDGDGYGGEVIMACIQPIGTITTGGDCFDASFDIHPGAPEDCNGIDEDCDGQIDEDVQISFYADNDGDGYGAGSAILACTAPENTVSNNVDCDDNAAAVNPGAQEICNGDIDDDCDGDSFSAPVISNISAGLSPICVNATTTLTANGVSGDGAMVNWRTGPGGTGSLLGQGLTLSDIGPGTYYAYVSGTCSPEAEVSITVDAIQPVIPTSEGTYTSVSVNHSDGTANNYIDASCYLLGGITDAVGGNVPGATTVTSELSGTVPSPNADGYVYGRRKYSVNAASSGAATMTLYFTQADFDNYNSNNSGFLDLPVSGNNADPNKLYFRIARVSGGAYTITASLADSLTWNGLESRWEVRFPVTSMNGEYYFVTMASCENVMVNNLAVTNIQGSSVLATWDNVVTTPAWGWYSLRYRTTSPVGNWIDAGTTGNGTTSKLILGLLPGTAYEIQIRRHCSNESTGPWSSAVAFTTSMPPCSFPPVLSVSSINANSAMLTWPAITDVGWFQFRYSAVSASGPWTSAGTLDGQATSKLLTGLSANTTYYVQARTFCASNSQPSPWSDVSFVTPAPSGCAQPPVLTATSINATNVTVTWPAIAGVGWYEFRYRLSPSGPWISGGTVGATAVSKLFNGLSPNTAYDIQARTYCTNGQPSAWGGITVTTIALAGCELPPVLTATSINATNVTVTWPAVSGAGWYEFRYRLSPAGSWISAGTAGATVVSKLFSSLAPSTAYDIQAKTFCSNGQASAWSGITVTTTALAGCELPPVMTVSAVTATRVSVTWPAISGAGWYEFRYSTSPTGPWMSGGTVGGSATSKTITGLSPVTTYYLQARTFCANSIASAWSGNVSFTTLGAAFVVQPSSEVISESENTVANDGNELQGSTETASGDELDITNTTAELTWSIYPNPGDGIFHLRLGSDTESDVQITVFDGFGKLVLTSKWSVLEGDNLHQLDLRHLEGGVYLVMVHQGEMVQTKKVVIMK